MDQALKRMMNARKERKSHKKKHKKRRIHKNQSTLVPKKPPPAKPPSKYPTIELMKPPTVERLNATGTATATETKAATATTTGKATTGTKATTVTKVDVKTKAATGTKADPEPDIYVQPKQKMRVITDLNGNTYNDIYDIEKIVNKLYADFAHDVPENEYNRLSAIRALIGGEYRYIPSSQYHTITRGFIRYFPKTVKLGRAARSDFRLKKGAHFWEHDPQNKCIMVTNFRWGFPWKLGKHHCIFFKERKKIWGSGPKRKKKPKKIKIEKLTELTKELQKFNEKYNFRARDIRIEKVNGNTKKGSLRDAIEALLAMDD